MKQFLKLLFILILPGLLICCSEENSRESQLTDFIPEEAILVLKVNDLQLLQRDIGQHDALSAFKSSAIYPILSGRHKILQHIRSVNPVLLSIIKLKDSTYGYTLVSRQDSLNFQIDSSKNRSSETLKYKDISIKRISLEDETVFTALKDSLFIASSSQQVLENLLTDKTYMKPSLQKNLSARNVKELSLIQLHPQLKLADTSLSDLAEFVQLDVSIAPTGITAAGVAVTSAENNYLIDSFKGQTPQENTIMSVLPSATNSVVSLTFNNAAVIVQNLRAFAGDSTHTTSVPLFETITEIAEISLPDGKAVAMHSIDAVAAGEALTAMRSEHAVFRDVEIFNFSEPGIFRSSFYPLISSSVNFGFRLDQYFVFTETVASAEGIISAYKSNDVIENTVYFKNSKQYLSDASSLLVMHFNGLVKSGIANVFFPELSSINSERAIDKYPLAVMQFTYDRDFAHVNFVSLETGSTKQITGRVTQLASKNLDRAILGSPQFFSNHRSGGQDIAVQDMSNKLQLLAVNGKTLWTKQLQGPILGEIQEVDLLRNGKKQLAFVTANSLHIIERNGKPVAPFPLKFKDKITQPLSVFDYDNNRNYRFAVVQGKEVFLYDNKGKIVSGFRFKKTASEIVQPIKHFRIGNKDYIVIPEANGTLNILSRVGTPRIQLRKKFNFSEIPITTEGSNFVVITREHTKESISQNGKLSSTNLSVTDSYWFTTAGRIKVTLDDNLLRIDGKLVELPFGIYTPPTIFRSGGNTYISITETQEKKVYIYNTDGSLHPGFPVYGSSAAMLGDANKNGRLNILVKGADSEIILYQLE